MKFVYFGLLLVLLGILGSCLGPPRERVDLTFVNATESLLCYYPSSTDAAGSDTCPEVKPSARTVWRPSCGHQDTDKVPLTVVLTIAPNGRVIYDRTAACGEWRRAYATFIIEQRGDQFVVTDSLP